jgi:type IV pilus assembly protein PilN
MIRINLLKPERKEVRELPTAAAGEFKAKKRFPYGLLILLVGIIAIVALYFYQKNEISKEQALLDAAIQEKKSLQYVEAKLQELEEQRNNLKRKIDLINNLKSQQANAVIIMDELSKKIPDWVWLTDASFSANRINFRGRAISNNLLADYIYNIKQSPYFDNVNLISSTLRQSGNNPYFEFSLTVDFIPPSNSEQASDTAGNGGQK